MFRSRLKTLQIALFLIALAGAEGAAQSTLAGPNPALRGFSPTQGMQGTTVNLTFAGTGFAGKSELQFAPATGLTVNDVHVVSATQVSAQVQIDAAAPLGPRQGHSARRSRRDRPTRCSVLSGQASSCVPFPHSRSGLRPIHYYHICVIRMPLSRRMYQ